VNDIYPDRTEERRDLFAAHAPEVPTWFERKVTWKKVIKTFHTVSGEELKRLEDEKVYEDPLEFLCRWKFAYADAMLKAGHG
jgi:hypothetical protein